MPLIPKLSRYFFCNELRQDLLTLINNANDDEIKLIYRVVSGLVD